MATKALRHEEQIRKIEKWENWEMGELFCYFPIQPFNLDSKNPLIERRLTQIKIELEAVQVGNSRIRDYSNKCFGRVAQNQ